MRLQHLYLYRNHPQLVPIGERDVPVDQRQLRVLSVPWLLWGVVLWKCLGSALVVLWD